MIMRAGLILTGSGVLASLLGFARNIIIARLISVENFGIAATFLMTASVLDLISNMSVDRLIVQARDGDDPKLISALQGIAMARGAMNAAILFLLAWPMAWLFGHPDIVWAYQLVALIPLIRGLSHTGVTRHQRQMKFGPQAIITLAPAIITLAAVWPLAIWLGDYRVMLAQMLIGMVVIVVATHLLAPDRFRVTWDWGVFSRAFTFGWPLLINGGLLFVVMQGDRLVISNQIGPYELGLFSAALTLAMTPSLIGARVMRLLFMPLLSRRQDDGSSLSAAFVVTMQAMICAGAAMAAGLAIVGPSVFVLAYGDRYAAGLPVLLWLALMFSLRLMREGSTTVAMSCARTKLPMMANLVRLVSLPLCFWAAAQEHGMTVVVMISVVGELGSFVVATALMHRWLGLLRLDRLGAPYALAFALMAVTAWIASDGATQAGTLDWRHGAIAALLCGVIAACGDLRARIIRQIRGR
jgi:O-antigen/teichoic acid export membrane protein